MRSIFKNQAADPLVDQNKAYMQLKEAVSKGHAEQVALYLSNKEWPITDPLVDPGYPDEDGYNPTLIYDLLYDAAPHPKVLELLLQDGRLDPNGSNQAAFYRCLLDGSVEGVTQFIKDGRIKIANDVLPKAAQTGGLKILNYLLEQDKSTNYQLFDQQSREQALGIATENKDKENMNLLIDYIDAIPANNTPNLC